MEDIESIVLNDENGIEFKFDVITKLNIDDKEYIIVVPSDRKEDKAIALRIDKDSEGNDIFVTIDDDDEFDLVCEAYRSLLN